MTRSLQLSPGRAGSLEIADVLRRAVTGGDLAPNSRLPSLADLARRFRATPVTVRHALRLLEEEGLLRVEHGVGTFVADWSRRLDLLHLPSFPRQMAEHSLAVETEVRERSTGVRHAPAARALGLPPEEPLAALSRLRRIDGAPFVFQCSYLAPSLASVPDEYRAGGSLYELLAEKTGRAPFSAEEEVRAIALPAVAATALERQAGAPGLLSARTTFDAAGEPLVYDEAYFAGDCVALRIRRNARRTELDYGRPAEAGGEEGEA